MKNILRDTIVAQCTPIGSGAIALIRLSGPDSFSIADKIGRLTGKKTLSSQPSHTIHYGTIINHITHKTIDQVLFLLMHGPKTFTGEHVVEITCHNNQFIIEAIIQESLHAGARMAQHGEFSQRAVMNNKLDLIQAEAINELIHANNQQSLKNALSQLEGSLSSWMHTIQRHLIKALAYCEASFEFIDEDMTFDDDIRTIIKQAQHLITDILKNNHGQQVIREGFRIALIGSVNAGKSSLFNALLDKERAIVTHIAGTTRDSLEAGLYKNGNYWTLIDTAGLRKTDDIIEQQGIERAYQEADRADIILMVYDTSQQLSLAEEQEYQQLYQKYQSKMFIIGNKCDLNSSNNHSVLGSYNPIYISAKNKQAIEHVEQKIEQKIKKIFDHGSPFLLNKRHADLLTDLNLKLLDIEQSLAGHIEYEILAYNLKDALSHIAELTGKTISEEGMDAIFREFCVGK